MTSNIVKFKQNLEKLIHTGNAFLSGLAQQNLSKFNYGYQRWYSEAYEVIRQLLPNRVDEFEKLYKGEKRGNVTGMTYTIQDWLLGIRSPVDDLTKVKGFEDFNITVMRFQNQLGILESARARFESSLLDIQQVVRADLFDSELDTAKELLKNGFLRAAGVVAGVVLEKHLKQVCINHNVTITNRKPTISYYNDLLKNAGVLDVPNWRPIQRLGDLRNLCGHNKDSEPKKEEVEELINGVEKVTKAIF